MPEAKKILGSVAISPDIIEESKNEVKNIEGFKKKDPRLSEPKRYFAFRCYFIRRNFA